MHEIVVNAQHCLFTSAAIRFAGSFTTNSTSINGINFSYQNFAIQIIKTTKSQLENKGEFKQLLTLKSNRIATVTMAITENDDSIFGDFSDIVLVSAYTQKT